MTTLRLFAFAVAALTSLSASAQSPTKPEAPESPGLAALVQPRVAELRTAGVKQIVVRTGKKARDVQALTNYGPLYFAWPKTVKEQVPFEIYLNSDGSVGVFANGFSDATRAKFSAALDAVVPQVIKGANQARANSQRPKA